MFVKNFFERRVYQYSNLLEKELLNSCKIVVEATAYFVKQATTKCS